MQGFYATRQAWGCNPKVERRSRIRATYGFGTPMAGMPKATVSVKPRTKGASASTQSAANAECALRSFCPPKLCGKLDTFYLLRSSPGRSPRRARVTCNRRDAPLALIVIQSDCQKVKFPNILVVYRIRFSVDMFKTSLHSG